MLKLVLGLGIFVQYILSPLSALIGIIFGFVFRDIGPTEGIMTGIIFAVILWFVGKVLRSIARFVHKVNQL